MKRVLVTGSSRGIGKVVADVCRDCGFAEMDGEAWDDVVRTDLDGFYNVVKPCLMPMVLGRIRGRIVAVSSASGVSGNRGQVNYAAAKAGLVGAVKSLAVEVAARGITVNAIAPGFIDAGMSAAMDADAAESARKSIPMQRFGRPEEVASLVSYLLSDGAAYLTRQVVSLNGGLY